MRTFRLAIAATAAASMAQAVKSQSLPAASAMTYADLADSR